MSGVKAKNKTNFETQMILNHQRALKFIIESRQLFTNTITYATVEEIHKRLIHNLGIESGIRRRSVRISASNYKPLINPHKLRECLDSILLIISKQQNPFRQNPTRFLSSAISSAL